MIGAVWTGDGTVALQEFPDPVPAEGEVVVEVRASGMCGSDLHMYHLSPEDQRWMRDDEGNPTICGHEPCGVVVEVGPGVGPSIHVGQRVVPHHYVGCGRCASCRTGWPQLCSDWRIFGYTRNGGHAPHMVAPASTIVTLPDEVSFEAGASANCGTGTAWGALQRAELRGTDTVVVVGQGPVGLACTMLAAALGARVVAVDVVASRLELATAAGAAAVLDASTVDVVEAVRELTGGRLADKAIDTSGAAPGQISAIRSAGLWGTVVMVGEGGVPTLDISRDVIAKQLTIRGSRTMSIVQLDDCLRFVAARSVPIDDLVTDRYPLGAVAEAYQAFDRGGSGKPVIVPTGS